MLKSEKEICWWYTKMFMLNKLLMVPLLQKVVKADDEARNALYYYSIFYLKTNITYSVLFSSVWYWYNKNLLLYVDKWLLLYRLISM